MSALSTSRSRRTSTATTASTNVSVDGAPSRDRILEVAREEFAQHGFRGARLQDIAERAGLTHPTLLYHFGSKEGLYAAVIEQAMEDWAAMTDAAASAGAERLRPGRGAGRRRLRRSSPPTTTSCVIWRREAIEGGGRLEEAMAEHMRPFLDRAVAFLRARGRGRAAAPARPDRADAARLRRGDRRTSPTRASARACSARTRSRPPRCTGFRHALTAMLRDATSAALSRPERNGFAVDHRVAVAGRVDRAARSARLAPSARSRSCSRRPRAGPGSPWWRTRSDSGSRAPSRRARRGRSAAASPGRPAVP